MAKKKAVDSNVEPKKKGKFYVQNFVTKNVVYAKTILKGGKKVFVFDKADMEKDDNGNYQPKPNAKPKRTITQAKFAAEARLHQRNAIVKDIMNTKKVSYKEAQQIFNVEKENIKKARIEGIMVQENMSRKNATVFYNDLVVHKKFKDLKKYSQSPNLEVSYRF